MITSIFKGLWTALTNPKLVLTLWIWNLILGLAATMPVRAWFGRALDTATETDALLTRFNIGTFNDLAKYNDIPPMGLAMAALTGVGILALVGNAFMNGGIVEVIGAKADSRTFMHRFFRGGGHFFWRFVRLTLVASVTGAFVVGTASAGIGAVTAGLADSEWEPAGLFWGLVSMTLSGLVALLFVLALDYARIQVARDGGRGMARAYFRALWFVVTHVFVTYGIAIFAVAGSALVLVAYIGHEATWTTATWPAILVLLGVQQFLILTRTALRVTQVGAEWEYFAMTASLPAAAPVPAPASPAPDAEPQAGTGPTPDHGEAAGAALADNERTTTNS